jgi:uncharacterized protein YceK
MRATLLSLTLALTLAFSGCGTIKSVGAGPGCGPVFGGTENDLSALVYSGFR